jgi:formate hydrogenlyase subunit 3/multisubunit Na+/H+ antiporter MnhD subunit
MNVTASESTIQNAILIILALVVIVICAWCIYAFIRAIFFFIFSQWKDDKIKKAWNSIRYMIMWIFLTVTFLFVFPLIFKWVWLDHSEVYTAKNIFNKAWEILSKTFQLKDVIRESQQQNQYRDQLYIDLDKQKNKYYEDYSL